MKYFLFTISLSFSLQFVFCQKPLDIAHVLDIPPALSGSFGELRSSNFHSGIDFRTQGVTGKNVFSMEDGFVSRIRITTGGYGKALYIEHPGGHTSVYAHLDDFNKEIDRFVKNYQYQEKTHALEIFPERERLPVKRGELIGYSGNTGSSSGPHLHFEIRQTIGQVPLNVLLYNDFGIKDHIAPVLYTLAVYPLDTSSQVNGKHDPAYLPLERLNNGDYRITGNVPVRVNGNIGFGLEAFDFINQSSLRCGVYSIELKAGQRTIFKFEADKFAFAETRYINAHLDYPLLMRQRKRLNLLYRKPNNRLSMYRNVVNNGMLKISNGDTVHNSIRVEDAAGNHSSLHFMSIGIPYNNNVKAVIPEHVAHFYWKSANRYTGSYSDIIIPSGALYEDAYFRYSVNELDGTIYPFIHQVHDSLTPLHSSATLRLKADNFPEALREKAVIVRISPGGEKTSAGGNWQANWLEAGIRTFGHYSIEVDTVPPVITPINISPGRNMQNAESIRFTIDDNLTGITEYNGFIDNEWVLFEYDPKNKLLFYTFDKARLKHGRKHELEVYLTDGVGNKTMYHTNFIW